MGKQAAFGNVDLARKMASRFGSDREPIRVKMRYAKEILKFIRKIDKAHKKAAQSKLVFR